MRNRVAKLVSETRAALLLLLMPSITGIVDTIVSARRIWRLCGYPWEIKKSLLNENVLKKTEHRIFVKLAEAMLGCSKVNFYLKNFQQTYIKNIAYFFD